MAKLTLEQNWGKLGFGELKIETGKDQHLFEIQVYLNNLDRQAIKVELYSAAMTKEMEYQGQIPNSQNGHIYRVEVPAAHPASSFTPRIIPYFQALLFLSNRLKSYGKGENEDKPPCRKTTSAGQCWLMFRI